MPPENYFRLGEGTGETVLHPLVLVAMLIAVLLILLLPRKQVIIPVLATIFLIPLGQQLLIGGFHFFVYRIIILVASIRILVAMFSTPEGAFQGRLDRLDKIFIAWAICRAAAVILLFAQVGALINQAGFLLDAIGGYFIFRHLIRDEEDIFRALRTFAAIAIVISVCMLYEKLTLVNVFGLLGGTRASPEIRGGAVRALGPFQHQLLAGCFGATLVPLFFLLWKTGKSSILAIVGALAATVMVVTSASSTPLLAWVAGIGAICLWPLRRKMRTVRWGIVVALAALQLVMHAPVWFLIKRADVIGGSSGYHRAMLVNNFIVHFRDWWLIGTKENAGWGFDMWDLSNQYVIEGQTGGLLAFLCFIALICVAFSKVGSARKAVEGDRHKEWYFWLLGCALFAHVVAYFGISYFDQTRFAWYAILAIVSAATAPVLVKVPVPFPTRRVAPSPYPIYGTYSPANAKSFVGLTARPRFTPRTNLEPKRGERFHFRSHPHIT
jgi:hypothetical protein